MRAGASQRLRLVARSRLRIFRRISAACRATAKLQDEWTRQLTQWAEKRLAAGETPLLDDALPEFERTLIRAALRQAQGGRQEAARLLGWGRNTLTRKLKDLTMDDE